MPLNFMHCPIHPVHFESIRFDSIRNLHHNFLFVLCSSLTHKFTLFYDLKSLFVRCRWWRKENDSVSNSGDNDSVTIIVQWQCVSAIIKIQYATAPMCDYNGKVSVWHKAKKKNWNKNNESEAKKVACVETILCECGFCMSLKRISQEVLLLHRTLFLFSFGSRRGKRMCIRREIHLFYFSLAFVSKWPFIFQIGLPFDNRKSLIIVWVWVLVSVCLCVMLLLFWKIGLLVLASENENENVNHGAT